MANSSRSTNSAFKNLQSFRSLTSKGGTRGQFSAVARKLSSNHRALSKIPGREGEARSARANSMRAKALANIAGRFRGGIASARNSNSRSAAPGGLKTGLVFAPGSRATNPPRASGGGGGGGGRSGGRGGSGGGGTSGS